MAVEAYRDALKLGQKAYREAATAGVYPYLPALDDMISNSDIETEMTLGLVEIPIKLIVGTKTAGRTNAFAGNFMPVLGEESEFAIKWKNLYEDLLSEGLRDPIKVYEYMNHFYVLEGNKRVSAMKYLGAASIPGTVIRMVPKKTNTRENKLYYEFLKFYNLTSINYIYFSRMGSYIKLFKLMGKNENEEWTDDDKLTFRSFFIRFENAYNAKAGAKPPISASDALLLYMNVYPYEKVKDDLPSQVKINLDKVWDEFKVHKDADQAIELSMTPASAPKKNVIMKLISSGESKKVLKIAFIHDKTSKTSGWTYGHELGRLHLEQKYPGQIITNVYENASPTNVEAALELIEKAISDGNMIIFTTTPKLLNASLKAAVQHPEVKILNCSLYTAHPYLRTYYARMYEAKFLTGAIAGAMARSGDVGYIADYPINGASANINAFALGVRAFNPRAKIFLEWSTLNEGRDLKKELIERGAYVISDKDMIVPERASRDFGLYGIRKGRDGEEDVTLNIAAPVWHWGKYYELIIRSILSGSWKADAPSGTSKALNYWWGMSSGVIDVICTQHMPVGTQKMIELLKETISNGEFHPFAGLIRDQEGNIRYDAKEPMTSEAIIKMDWLVEGIEGHIPEMHELTAEAQQIVRLQGINKGLEDETATETVE